MLSPQIICWFLSCAGKEGKRLAEGLDIRREDNRTFWNLKKMATKYIRLNLPRLPGFERS